MWPFMTGLLHFRVVFKVHPYGSVYQYVIPFNGRVIFHCMDILEYLGCFPFLLLRIMLLCTFMSKFSVDLCFHFFWYIHILRSGIAESDNSV